MNAAQQIRFDGLLQEAKYAFHASDFKKAELLLSEASDMAAHERRVAEGFSQDGEVAS